MLLSCMALTIDTRESVRLSEASIIGLFVWQTWIPNTNRANSICALGPKAQMRVARFVFGKHVGRTNGQRYLPLISVVENIFVEGWVIPKLNIMVIHWDRSIEMPRSVSKLHDTVCFCSQMGYQCPRANL